MKPFNQGRRKVWRWLVLVLIMTAGVGTARLQAQQANIPEAVLNYADFVLYNGKIVTADKNFSIAEAVAVRGNKYLAVGTTAQVLPMAGPKTRKIDLKGKTVTPGIFDLHGGPSGILRDYWEDHWFPEGRPNWKTKEEALAGIKKVVARAKPGEVILIFQQALGGGYPIDPVLGARSGHFCDVITLQEMDAVSPNNPIIAPTGVNSMTIWMNSAAAKATQRFLPKGVTTPFLKPNNICTHHGGSEGGIRPPGSQAGDDLAFWLIPPDDEKMLKYYKEDVAGFSSSGVTLGKQHMGPPLFNGIRELWRRGELNMRFRMPMPLSPQVSGHETHLDPAEAEIWMRRWMNLTGIGDDMLRITGLRIPAVGGNVPRADAWMIDPKVRPYIDRSGNASPYGRSYSEIEDPYHELFRARTTAIQACRFGWDVSADHTIGDRAYREVINAFEECKKDPVVKRSDQRLTTNHTPMAKLEDIQKAAKLGVWSSISTGHSIGGTNSVDLEVGLLWAGTERVDKWSPIKSYIKEGLHPSLEGTIWDWGPPRGIEGGGRGNRSAFFWVGKSITRKDEKYRRVWNSAEALTRQEALWASTLWSAEQLAEDNKLGSIEPGKLADLLIIDRDYMTVQPADEIEKIQVLLTIVDGRVVYEKEGALQ